MKNDHPISDEVIELANIALSKGEHWMAYNQSPYFIDKDDVHFFKLQNEAKEFANNNFSDRDAYHVINFNSILDIFKKIPYPENVEKNLVDNPDINGLYNYEGNAFTDALIEHIEQQQLSLFNSQLKTNIMNNENFQYLSDNIKYMGFGESLKSDLEKSFNEGKHEFQLNYKTEINKKPFEANLNFRKSENSDLYFFNSYKASLQKTNGESADQTFYLNRGKGVTAKEAYNLLEGRSVYKDLTNRDGEPYKAWLQIDFENKDKNNNHEMKQFHENYGFDVKDAVSKFSIPDLNDDEKSKALIQSLQKGNIQSVSIEKDGSAQKMFIEANPQYKSVNLYDGQLKRVMKEGLDQYKSVTHDLAKVAKQEKKTDLKQDQKEDVSKSKNQKASKTLDQPKQKKERSKTRSVSL